MACHGCGGQVSGAVIQALGRLYHPQCFCCAGCGRAIYMERYLEHQGQPYHAPCHAKAFSPNCAHCHKPIVGTYRATSNKVWHEHCFLCKACGTLLDPKHFVEKLGDPYHEPCYFKTFHPDCAVCGRKIQKFFKRNSWGDLYCPSHEKDCPSCFSCRRPISRRLTGGGQRLQDGRQMCALCLQTGVQSHQTADKLVSQVVDFLQKHGLTLQSTPDLVWTPLKGLKKLQKGRGLLPPAALPSHQDDNWTLLVLQSLPKAHFQAAVASGLAKLWLQQQGCGRLKTKETEGFAAWWSCVWLEKQGDLLSAQLLRAHRYRKDAIYGLGLQITQKQIQKLGIIPFLRHLAAKKRYPAHGSFFGKLLG